MVWRGITSGRKTYPVIIEDNFNALKYVNEIFAPSVMPKILNNPGLIIYQNDNAHACIPRAPTIIT